MIENNSLLAIEFSTGLKLKKEKEKRNKVSEIAEWDIKVLPKQLLGV